MDNAKPLKELDEYHKSSCIQVNTHNQYKAYERD